MSDPCPGRCCIDDDHEHLGPWVGLFAKPGRGVVVYNFEAIGADPPGAFTARGSETAGRDDVRASMAAGGADDAVTVTGKATAAQVLEAVRGLAARGGTVYVAPGTVITE